MFKLDYSQRSKNDLIAIFEAIKKDKPNAAREYAKKLKEYIELLVANPNMGNKCKNKNVKIECRVLVFKSHLVFYKIKAKGLLIIRIINSKENYNSKL